MSGLRHSLLSCHLTSSPRSGKIPYCEKSGMTSHMKLTLHVMAGHTQSPGLLFSCPCAALGNALETANAREAVLCHARDICAALTYSVKKQLLASCPAKYFKKNKPKLLDLAWVLSGQLSNSGNLVPRILKRVRAR